MLETFLSSIPSGWSVWTLFGNAAFVLPLIILAIGLLALAGQWRAAAAWTLAVFVCSSLVAASKVAFFAWGWGVRPWNLTCISGHTVMATLCWPIMLGLLISPERPRARTAAMLAGTTLAILVGISRVETGAHSGAEVVAGFILAGGALAVIWHCFDGVRVGAYLPLTIGAFALLIALAGLPLLHGGQLPSERWWQQMARQMTGHPTVYLRAHWLRGDMH